MKFLLITGIYPPEIGGPATYIPQLAKHLIQSGHKVTVLTLQKKGIIHLDNDSWKVEYVPAFSNLPVRIFATIFRIVILARKHDYVFSNGLYFETGIALALVRRRSVVKVVGNPIWERNRNKNAKLKSGYGNNAIPLTRNQKLQSRILVFALNQFTFVTCPSEALCEDVQEWGLQEKPRFIPNGVTVRKPVTRKKDIDVIAVSRLVNWKNTDVLIKSCASLGLKLWIIGEGPEMTNLQNLAENIKANVVFLGELPASEISAYLDRSRCFVLISDYEGLSFSLLEAMNCRVPVIVSDVPGNRSVVQSQKYGEIVSLISPAEVSKKIITTLASENSEMIENAYQLVKQKYDLQSNFAQILNLMDSR